MPDTFLSNDFVAASDPDAQMHRLLTLISLIEDPTSVSGLNGSGLPAPGDGMTLAGNSTENGLFAYNSILNEEATAIADARGKAASERGVSRSSGSIHSGGASPVAAANLVAIAAPIMPGHAGTMAIAAAATNSFTFTITSAAQFNSDVALIDVGGADAGGTNNTYNFNITAGFTLDRQLDAINLTNGTASGDVLNISGASASGGVATVDGGGKYNGLFVYNGTVNVSDLTIQNAVAKGGAGGAGTYPTNAIRSGGGGAGAGLGGGLFVAGPNSVAYGSATLTTGGHVSLLNVAFTGDSAIGGAGGNLSVGTNSNGGGGGGLGGAGGTGSGYYGVGGGGGVGLGAQGGSNNGNGGIGIIIGTQPGGSTIKNGTGGANAGGGGSDHGLFEAGGGGGVGGAAVYRKNNGYHGTPSGGFGGGGGSGIGGGFGGFGGGGGGALGPYSYGGNGGFGGGGGAGADTFAVPVSGVGGGFGGFGGGRSGLYGYGGGGLGAGGDIFVQQGGQLTIGAGSSLAAGTVTGGVGAGGMPGSFNGVPFKSVAGTAFGNGLFIQGNQTVTFGGAGGPVTVAGVIADETGSVMPTGDGTGTGAGALAVGDVLLTLSGANTYSGGTTITGGSLDLDQADVVANGKVVSGAAGTGAIIFAGSAAAPSYLTLESVAQPANGGTFATTLTNFGTNDAFFLKSVTYTSASTAIYNASTHVLTVSSNGKTESFTLNAPTATTFYTHASVFGSGMRVDSVACYCRGTRIETPVGDVEIEALAVGDLVVTASGVARPIRWIGTRRFDPRFVGRNPKILPIRICRDALADGVPRRDLLVSPEHAMLIDDVLVAAKHLVNGVSIRQEDPGAIIEYFHLELDTHDVVLAEGAAAETYIEDGDRGMFHNAVAYRAERPAQPPRYCADRIEHGARLEAIRAELDARAGVRAIVTEEPDIHLLADGRIILPCAGPNGALAFDLPHPVRDLVLVSRRTTGTGADRRGLGIAVAGITIDDRPIELARLSDRGWHDLEGDGGRLWRWTDGAGQLFSTRRPCRLTIEIAGTLRYRRLAQAA